MPPGSIYALLQTSIILALQLGMSCLCFCILPDADRIVSRFAGTQFFFEGLATTSLLAADQYNGWLLEMQQTGFLLSLMAMAMPILLLLEQRLITPALNVITIESDASFSQAVMTEPIACVLHCTDFGVRANGRYRLAPQAPASERVRTTVILGAGPAGLLFVQVLRKRYAFDGPIVVSDPSPEKRALANRLGAVAVAPEELEAAVIEQSKGRRAELLIEATGSGPVFATIPNLIRKQATVLLYGVGHGGASLELLNPLQWREAVLVTSVGASGGFDPDGRPTIYRDALQMLERGDIEVDGLLTHEYSGLPAIPDAFTGAHTDRDYIKGIAVLS